MAGPRAMRGTGCMGWGWWGGAVLHGGGDVTWEGVVVHARQA